MVNINKELDLPEDYYHFLFKLSRYANREAFKKFLNDHKVVYTETTDNNKFYCIGSIDLIFDKTMHNFGMSQDWVYME